MRKKPIFLPKKRGGATKTSKPQGEGAQEFTKKKKVAMRSKGRKACNEVKKTKALDGKK